METIIPVKRLKWTTCLKLECGIYWWIQLLIKKRRGGFRWSTGRLARFGRLDCFRIQRWWKIKHDIGFGLDAGLQWKKWKEEFKCSERGSCAPLSTWWGYETRREMKKREMRMNLKNVSASVNILPKRIHFYMFTCPFIWHCKLEWLLFITP